MKRIAILLLALLLLLPACGRAAPEPAPEESTTAPVTQIIAEPTWRLVPTDDAMKADIAAWWGEPDAAWELGELKLSEAKTVILRRGWNADESFVVSSTILLRDETDGSETVLLEHNNPNYSTSSSRSPIPAQALDERYFVINWYYYEGSAGCSVFDTQEKRDIPIQFPEGSLSARFIGFAGGWLYFGHRAYSYEPGDPLHITRIALDALLADSNLPAAEMIRDTQVGYTAQYLISPGGRYLAASESRADYATDEDAFLLVYDLAQGKNVLRLPRPEGYGFWYTRFADDNMLYFYDFNDDSHVLEVMLP